MKLSLVVTTHGAMKTSSSSRLLAVMYDCDCTRQPSPITVSFSTVTPRPMTVWEPIEQRSRTKAWSPMITRSPSVVPA